MKLILTCLKQIMGEIHLIEFLVGIFWLPLKEFYLTQKRKKNNLGVYKMRS